MLGLVRHVRAKVAADDAVPRRVVLFVELLLDVRRYILFDIVFFECLKNYNVIHDYIFVE